jgi:exodeoxyribonuclease VII large subunit
VDDAAAEMNRLVRQKLHDARQEWLAASQGIVRYDFRRLLRLKRAALGERAVQLDAQFRKILVVRRNRLAQAEALLRERSPLTILNRGYSITRDARGRIVRDAEHVSVGDDLSIRLARGELGATIREKKL